MIRRDLVSVLGVPIDSITWEGALSQIAEWGQRGDSKYVCLCNVHSVVTAAHDRQFHRAIAASDMATPDGAPVAWMLRRLGRPDQVRVNGPDLMWSLFNVLQTTAPRSSSVFLYGSTDETLASVRARCFDAFPAVRIVGAISPPFRELTEEEDNAIVSRINESGAGLVFVGLGCPKQELWMAEHRGRINAVMLGVGAAFDFHARTTRRAPEWMQHNGLEWLYRLLSEPKRLWRRYLVSNSLFIAGATKQLIRRRLGK